MKRMLFNATQQEELRVAIVNGQKLIDIDIETAGRELRKSNIYKGIITRIEPSLEACFVNYGEDRHGFLPFKEVARSYFREGIDVRTATIKEALREGQEIMVQVEKEERGNKGAALTSFISLAGRYLVLMPNNPKGGGVSRRVEGEERQELRETMDKLDLPTGMSVIARTAGIGRNVDELQWDLNYLLQLWRAIESAGTSQPGAFLIYQESSLVIRAIRDYFQPDIGEILIDTDEIYEQAQQFMSHVMPDMVHRVKRYSDDVPLFSRFQIEHQIETAYSRTVPLPSGGAIVIDHTEALVSVDVNSARATRGGDIETTAFNTNLEAADEVARQLRLRDLGGLIVIDFIDMENSKNQREVETRLKDALRYDRARVQMGKISRFGLMELSRQRLRPSLSEGSHVTCPRCNGTGHIRDTESSALQVLRIIQEEAMKENSALIHVQTPVDVAAFLLNEKRGEILKIETRHRVTVVLIPNKHLETPHYRLERIKHDDPRLEDAQASYTLAEQADTDIGFNKRQKEEAKPRQEAVVKSITPEQAPLVEKKVVPEQAGQTPASGGFFSWLTGLFRSKPATPAAGAPANADDKGSRERTTRTRNRRGGRGRDRDDVATTPSAGKSDKPQREKAPRESREAREEARPVTDAVSTPRQGRGRAAREERETGTVDASPRRERTPRPPREERKPALSGEPQQETEELRPNGLIGSTPAVASLASSSSASAQESQTHEDRLSDEGTDGEASEERRRRRRRGGRNRHRRDREGMEGVQENLPLEEGESESPAQASSAALPEPVTPAIVPAPAAPVDIQETASEPKQAIEPAKPAEVSEVVERAEAAVSAEMPALIAPLVAQTTEPLPLAEPAAPASGISEADVEVNTARHETPLTTAPAPTSEVQAIHAATVSVATTVTEPTLDAVLARVGLIMASTDPEKWAKAQAEATQHQPPVRAPRVRKPAPVIDAGPLEQVETRR